MTADSVPWPPPPTRFSQADINSLARRLLATEDVRDEAIARLTVILGAFDDECRLDHNGFCQAHLVSKPCEIDEARQFLARVRR